MGYLALFFAGAFLCNCIPHLAAGLRGEAFPTPFAKPPARGLSSPPVNFVWGFANVLVGGILLWRHGAPGDAADIAAMALGAFAIGLYLAVHFGKVRRELRQEGHGG